MAFSFYSPLTVNTGQVPSTQTDFPVLVSYTDNRFKTVGNGGHVQNSSGFDIRPYSDSSLTTALTYELVFYDGTNGIIEMWVKRSSLSDGTVTYLAYGDSTITTDGSSTSTWSNNFAAVYHLKDGTTLSALDSTGSHNGTNHGGTAATGQIDGGVGLVTASTQYIDCGAISGSNTACTLSGWAKAVSFPQPYNTIIIRNSANSIYFGIFVKSTGKMAWAISNLAAQDGTGSHTLSTGTWYYATLTYDNAGSGLVGYINAASDATHAAQGVLTTAAIQTDIGRDNANGRYWNGTLDEARMATVARSANWVTTEYNNQVAPSTFMTLGTESTTAIQQAISSILSFTTNFQVSHNGVSQNFQSFIATLFPASSSAIGYGVLSKITNRTITAALSFVGAIKRTTQALRAGVLSFSGSITRRTFKHIAGTLSFAGLWFIGNPSSISLTASLNFSGSLSKSVSRNLTAALSFIGNLLRRTLKSVTAILSFSGFWSTGTRAFVSLTAALSFSGSLSKSIRRILTASLSFIGHTIIRFNGVFRETFTAALSFAGTLVMIRPKIFTAALSFIGSCTKKFPKLFTARLSFAVDEFLRTHGGARFITFVSRLSFSGVTSRATQFHRLLNEATLRLIGIFFPEPASPIRKVLITTLLFDGDLTIKPSVIQVLLEATLRFRGRMSNAWGHITALFNVLITTLGQFLTSGTSRQDTQSLTVSNTQETITNTPSILTTTPDELAILFVKNLDSQATVEVDDDITFDSFPQSIPPTSGIYLCPDSAPTVYVRSSALSSDIQVITAGRNTAPPPPPGNGVLRSNGSVADAYLEKDLGSQQPEVWLTFDLAFDSTALAFWEASPFGGAGLAELCNNDPNNQMIGWFVGPGVNWENYGIGGGVESSPAPVAATWQHIEYHYETTAALFEFYINGSLVHTHNGSPSPALDIQFVHVGQRFVYGNPAEANVFMKAVKIGSTREGSEYLAEDFTGDLSAWTVFGNCTIVGNPY